MQAKITTKLEECFLIAEKFFDRTFERPEEIIFKREGTRGGYSWYAKREMMFQLDFAEANEEDYINQVVPHECAHYVQDQLYPRSKAHGREWKYIMRACFKLAPDRCHSYDYSVTKTKAGYKQTRHIYGCDCGKTFKISTTMHNRIQNAIKESKSRRYYDANMKAYNPKPTYSKVCVACRGTITLKEEGDSDAQKLQNLMKKLQMEVAKASSKH